MTANLKGMTMRDLLNEQRYEEIEATKTLLAFCREDIVSARLRLASGGEPHFRRACKTLAARRRQRMVHENDC